MAGTAAWQLWAESQRVTAGLAGPLSLSQAAVLVKHRRREYWLARAARWAGSAMMPQLGYAARLTGHAGGCQALNVTGDHGGACHADKRGTVY